MSELNKSVDFASGIRHVLSVTLLLLISISSPLLSVAQLDNWTSHNVPDAGGPLLGEVRSLDNLPVNNAQVKIQALFNGTLRSTFTDAAGRFDFGDVPNGSYTLSVVVGANETTESIDTFGSRTQITVAIAMQGPPSTGGQPTISVNQLAAPARARKALQKALEALHMNRLADANMYLDKALIAYPRYAVALTLRGIITMDRDPQQACGDFQKAIEYDPNHGPAYAALGSVYNHLGRYDDAALTLDHALVLAPTFWPSYYELSVASLGKADFTAALRLVEKASTLAPMKYPPMHMIKALAFIGLQNTPAATTELKTFLLEAPNDPLAPKARRKLESLAAASIGR
jgi:tetratricopeptide (TPR) repeat protein